MKNFFALSICLLWSSTTLAQSVGVQAVPAQTSIETVKKESPYAVSYWGMLTGPSIGNPSFYQSDSISGNVDHTSPDALSNQVKLEYKLNPNISVGLVVNWLMQTDADTPALMRESGLRFADKSIAKFGAFNWSGDFRFLLPTSTRAHNGGVTQLLQTSQVIAGDVGKWTLGVAQFHTLRLFNQTGGGKKLDLYVSPFANYNVNDVTSATFAIESYPQYFTGVSSEQGWNPAPYDVSIGAAFNITKDINVNPVLITYPDHFNINTTALAAYFTAKLL